MVITIWTVREMKEVSGELTRSQKNFLNKLVEESAERLEASEKYLKTMGKGDISELTVQEASRLIDELTKIKVENGGRAGGTGGPTPKQKSFISKLQDSEERISFTKQFLERYDKKSVDDLDIKEASMLIDGLMDKKGDQDKSARQTDFQATPKQVNFIRNLQKTERDQKIVEDFLKSAGKKTLEEITRTEASTLIEKLKV